IRAGQQAVVDGDRLQGRVRGAAGTVEQYGAQVVDGAGDLRGVPGAGVRRGGVGADVGPAGSAGGGVLEPHRGDTRGGVGDGRERGRAAHQDAGVVQGDRGDRVVDGAVGDGGRGRRVAGLVGGDRAERVRAVGQ